MKTELRLVDHSVLPNTKIVEIWYNSRFIGTVTPADGPGVRIISHYLDVNEIIITATEPPLLEVRLNDLQRS